MSTPRKSRLNTWLYRGSLAVLILLFVGFSVVMPIDAMAQASRSTNDALNTFIVVGAFVAFGVLSIIIALGRVIVHRSCLQDIPKQYLPIAPEDLPHKGSRNLLHRQMDRSHELAAIFKSPSEKIVHAGLSRPFDNDEEATLPPLLNYEDCIKIITSRFKYQGVFSNLMELNSPTGKTLADVVHELFTESGKHPIEAAEYVDLYEHIRFSGDEITSNQFLRFMDLSLYLVYALLRAHNYDEPQETDLDASQVDDIDSFNTQAPAPFLAVESDTDVRYLTTTNTNSTVARRVTAGTHDLETNDGQASDLDSGSSVRRAPLTSYEKL
ncbi:LADA_0E02014g1_1 [Lachancea dasiensis]|uniref:Defect at low temperature protein 1 n=1 Tax=Lachancea dasiensis TaxID=1072105 RepID=A0A1G4JAL5_9SACH|nr:LADA_0E02014g1_1 [Lachancea dasiensis]